MRMTTTNFQAAAIFSDSNPNPYSIEEMRNWLELPEEVILLKLGAVEIFNNAQNVCSLWRKICKDPLMWSVIDKYNFGDLHDTEYSLVKICKHAVDRSCGGLIDIDIEYFGTDELLEYITKSSNRLRRLRIACCYEISDEGLIQAVSKLPLLENLEICLHYLAPESLIAIGRCCPLLKSFKFNWEGYRIPRYQSDEEALAIADNMPNLRHLQIICNDLTNKGLRAILDGCSDLESLDLRVCFNLNLDGPLGSKCAQRIKNLRLPHDSLRDYDYEFNPIVVDCNPQNNYYDVNYYDDYSFIFSNFDFLTDHYEFSGGGKTSMT